MARRASRFRCVRVEGTWYRLVRQGRDPLDFARTRSAGGRYHPPRSYPVLYFGDQPATCLLEVLVHAFELPRTYDVVAVDLRLRRVADLASAAGRTAARVTVEELVSPPRPIAGADGTPIGTRHGLTWALGKRAFERGLDGLVVPSAALPAQRVLVVFRRPSLRLAVRSREPIATDPRMRRLFGR